MIGSTQENCIPNNKGMTMKISTELGGNELNDDKVSLLRETENALYHTGSLAVQKAIWLTNILKCSIGSIDPSYFLKVGGSRGLKVSMMANVEGNRMTMFTICTDKFSLLDLVLLSWVFLHKLISVWSE